MLSDFPLLVKPGLPHLPRNRARLCEWRSGWARGEDIVYPPGGRLQGAGALRCQTFPQHALDRQLEISRLLPATNGEGFFFFPLFCLLHFRGKRKETFLGFKINKASQQTTRGGESKGSSSRAFEPKNQTKVEKLRRLPPVSKASQTISKEVQFQRASHIPLVRSINIYKTSRYV